MMRSRAMVLLLLTGGSALAASEPAPVAYRLDLEGRDHHEIQIEVEFRDLEPEPLEIRMSRTSPGRYALHEFAKNVYSVTAQDGTGRPLSIERSDLHGWTVADHDGTVRFRYTLFGDRCDGTYAAIDSSHVHLNVPAAFVWARGLEARPVEVRVDDLPAGWRVFGQLLPGEDGAHRAPDLAYFIDSPLEISDAEVASWTLGDGDGAPTVEIVLHHDADEDLLAPLVQITRRIVDEAVAVFGELPAFDHGRYTFLIDALPWCRGDGMEHRNSTVITRSGGVEEGTDPLLGTVAHEVLHAWNVERLRPASLEPFDLERANVSGELWFGEGITNYLEGLVLVRAGAAHPEAAAEALGKLVDRIVRAPGVGQRSVVEMSRHAPFLDAATANDPTNFQNTYLSYYTYGDGLGLALDLTLRRLEPAHSLEEVVQELWRDLGRTEVPYAQADLEAALARVTGDPKLARRIFAEWVEGRVLPDFEALLAAFAIRLRRAHPEAAWLGPLSALEPSEDPEAPGLLLADGPRRDTPLHRAGVGRGDRLVSLGGQALDTPDELESLLANHEPGEELELVFDKRGRERTVALELAADPKLEARLFEAVGELDPEASERRRRWWQARTSTDDPPRRRCPVTGQSHPFTFRYCPVHGDRLELATD